MGDTDFFDAVGERGDLDPADADAATEATLAVLGDHLADTVVTDLTDPLPDDIAEAFEAAATDPPSAFDYEAFVSRVADRIGVDEGEAERRARAVGATLADRADDDALAAAREQLPEEYDRLFWMAESDDLLERVAAEGGLDSTDAAREATAAVLATLGERITPGEAEAVAAYLPDEFATALAPEEDVAGGAGAVTADPEAEETETDAVAADYDVAAFVERVAEREGVDEETAAEHVGAVSDALGGAVPSREFTDVLEQLPDAYGTVL